MKSPPVNPDTTKRSLRERVRKWSATLSRESRQHLSIQACAILEQQEVWREANRILFYVPLRDEIDVASLLLRALEEGKTVALPSYRPEEDCYSAVLIKNFADDLAAGRFGISEPRGSCAMIALNQLDLILVPGLAFSRFGQRLGRGRGYYDRLLAGISGWKCGIAFDEQLFDEIPREAHDVALNSILTPTRWIVCDDHSGGS
jgi:5-formyltetrahydrofolate cyclo-ligase